MAFSELRGEGGSVVGGWGNVERILYQMLYLKQCNIKIINEK